MTSPLTQFENARLLWRSPGARSSGREGFTVSEGDAYLIMCFLKRKSADSDLTDRLNLPAIDGQPLEFSGYVVRYAVLPQVEVPNFTTTDLSALTFDTSMLLPPGVSRDARAKLYIPGLEQVEVRFTNKNSSFGHDGIGGILRGVLGDQLYLSGGQIG